MIYVIRLGVVTGIIWGLVVLLLSISSKMNYGVLLFKSISAIYPGCNSNNFMGKFICWLLGTLDGFFIGVIFALLYNNLNIKY